MKTAGWRRSGHPGQYEPVMQACTFPAQCAADAGRMRWQLGIKSSWRPEKFPATGRRIPV